MDCGDEVTSVWANDVKTANCFQEAGFGQFSQFDEEDGI